MPAQSAQEALNHYETEIYLTGMLFRFLLLSCMCMLLKWNGRTGILFLPV